MLLLKAERGVAAADLSLLAPPESQNVFGSAKTSFRVDSVECRIFFVELSVAGILARCKYVSAISFLTRPAIF